MSKYAQRMGRLAARVFGEVARPTHRKSYKVQQMFSEKPVYMRPEVVNYYPNYKAINRLTLKLRLYGLYRNEHDEFVEEMKQQRILRGKSKPKKGQGKRATRRY